MTESIYVVVPRPSGTEVDFALHQEDALVITMQNVVWIHNVATTTSTTPNQIAATYTVPAGKVLYVIDAMISRVTQNGVGADLRISATTERAKVSDSGAGPQCEVRWAFGAGVPAQVAGSAFNLTITPTAATSTQWAGTIVGFLRDA